MNTLKMCLASLFVVVAMVGCGPLAGVGLNGEPIFDKDSGSTDGNVLQNDDGGAKTDADGGSQQDNGPGDGGTQGDEVGQDGTADAGPTCPPKDRPTATIMVTLKSSTVCVSTETEKKWAQEIDSRTWKYVEKCGTLPDKKQCTKTTTFHDVGFVPIGAPWGEVPEKFKKNFVLEINGGYTFMITSDGSKATFETPAYNGLIIYHSIDYDGAALYMTIRYLDINANEEVFHSKYKAE